MIKKIVNSLFIVLFSAVLHAQGLPALREEKPLGAGMRIIQSTRIKKGNYKIDAPAKMEEAVIIIEGDNITVDFNHAVLTGSNTAKKPDEFTGVAVLVRNSKNVTLKNLNARGYQVALRATNVERLTVENCDFSYNYRQHLNSSPEKEDLSDWMSYHHNEKDEWLRYGAGLYLRNCQFATIRYCKVTGGQNALMMMECNNGKIYNNDFSFNSGIGLGMYQCNSNEVCYNRICFNVRGYSHGVYNRGQDSAGILVFEQSNDNKFYWNNVTHGGDGFFLWAGQTTMDRGTGGCNGNILYQNDFSYAPTNGIEVTFSRNTIAGNKIAECDHGVWGGYSFETAIESNQFSNNRIGIAIEHGSRNRIIRNTFNADKEAIRLWARKEQPADWGYAKYRDTRSAYYTISGNQFYDIPLAFNLNRTDTLYIHDNEFMGTAGTIFKTDSTTKNLDSIALDPVDDIISPIPEPALAAAIVPIDPFKNMERFAGRKNIMITEWGPYDFNSPLIWNTNPTDTSDLMKFDLLGPGGKWKIKTFRGVKNISAGNGIFPAAITAQKISGERTDVVIELEYTGPAITTPLGKKVAAGKSYRFSFQKFFQPINWELMFYSLDTANHNPIKTGTLFSMFEKKAPFKTEKVNKLDYAWWGGIKEAGINHAQFITVAAGNAEIPIGDYELSVTWDDAVRVFVDEKLVIDEWNPSLYTFDESPHKKVQLSLGGNHHFRVEHVELGGFATLSLKLKPVD